MCLDNEDFVSMNNATYTTTDVQLKTKCLICGEDVSVDKYETVKICDRCKKAILKMRNQIEKEEYDKYESHVPTQEEREAFWENK